MASPAFQFYPRDFLADRHVAVMNAEERGVYITLLSYCWLENGLPDDEEELASLAGMDTPRFRALWSKRVGRCFRKNEAGLLVNARLEEERAKQEAFRAERSASGRRGAGVRWLHSSAIAQPSTPGGSATREPMAVDSSSSSSAICDLRSAEEKTTRARDEDKDEDPDAGKSLPLTLEPDPIPPPDPAEISAQKYIDWFNRKFHRTFDWQTYVEPIRVLQRKYKATDRQLQEVAIYLRCLWEESPKMRQHLKPSTLLRPTEWPNRLSEATEWMAADCPALAPVYPTMTGNEPKPPLAAPRRVSGQPVQPGSLLSGLVRGGR